MLLSAHGGHPVESDLDLQKLLVIKRLVQQRNANADWNRDDELAMLDSVAVIPYQVMHFDNGETALTSANGIADGNRSLRVALDIHRPFQACERRTRQTNHCNDKRLTAAEYA